ncbi:tripartite tricarboxylate transporter TctB family protein [Spongiactinospora sp. TRM90649]|uniref:tripartite tricarboxylate transporter TctB family protein n=1 Tax=Spongiactinospora sp. TRM90649 TaxID=3031114 RepID=UPI0023F79FF1|nr:tripartite tricarboxylate transporter TctB family protein [Spongiactinospora sp. TRM90649]MDF5753400.1 tripartite tricarboxylate transporter TctB family protein [Spongiactinospora sp. TRM90649]
MAEGGRRWRPSLWGGGWAVEVVPAVGVLGLGVYVIVGTAGVGTASAALGPGPRFFPVVVGVALVLTGVCYVIDVLRGGRGDPEHGEDMDSSAPGDLRAVALTSGIFLGFAVTLDLLGWIIGGALLFFGLAVVLGARRRARAAGLAVVLSVVTHVAFVEGLGVTLPAGLLSGVL